MSRGAISEQSSVREGASYDEVYQTGHEPEEGHSRSSKRETSTRSPDEDWENYIGEEERDEGEVEGDRVTKGDEDDTDDRALEIGSLGNLESGHTRPFILSKIWTINDFLPTMKTKIFKDLRDRYQILNHILIRLPGKFEKCYWGKTADFGMYNAMLAAGLRLPLTALHL